MKASQIVIAKKRKIPKYCSNCKCKESDRWHILLLCCSSRSRHYLLCESCYPYYDNASYDYKYWLDRNMENYEKCSCYYYGE